jgi:hypothetical protein
MQQQRKNLSLVLEKKIEYAISTIKKPFKTLPIVKKKLFLRASWQIKLERLQTTFSP